MAPVKWRDTSAARPSVAFEAARPLLQASPAPQRPEVVRDLLFSIDPKAPGYEPPALPGSPAQKALLKTTTALDGLARAVERSPRALASNRVSAAISALAQAAPHLKPSNSAADREPVAASMESLRSVLIAAGPVGLDPARSADAQELVSKFNLLAYALSLEPLCLVERSDKLQFVRFEDQLADVPAGVSKLHGAPELELRDGSQVVPGQFRQYRLTQDDVQNIVARTQLPPELIAWVGQDPGDRTPYIQMGIVGPDNYKGRDTNPEKLVYGRRWRVEPELPEYEVMQTVFAAARDALSHEVRELFTIDGRTPFSGHVDATLLGEIKRTGSVAVPDNPVVSTLEDVQAVLSKAKFGGRKITLLEVERHPRSGRMSIVFETPPRPAGRPIPFVDGQVLEASATAAPGSSEIRGSDVLYALNEEFVRQGLRYLEESFRFDGEARFSHENDPRYLGAVSAFTRHLSGEADGIGKATNSASEQQRAPVIAPGAATTAAVEKIGEHNPLLGFAPKLLTKR